MSKTLPTLIATLALSGCLIKNEPNPPVAPSIRIKHPVAQICDKILGSPMDPAIITEEMFTPENGWDTGRIHMTLTHLDLYSKSPGIDAELAKEMSTLIDSQFTELSKTNSLVEATQMIRKHITGLFYLLHKKMVLEEVLGCDIKRFV